MAENEVIPVKPEKKVIRNKTAEKPLEMTVETAKALIELREKQRAETCSQELENLLSRHNCQISGAYVFDSSGARVVFSIVALPEK